MITVGQLVKYQTLAKIFVFIVTKRLLGNSFSAGIANTTEKSDAFLSKSTK